MARRSPSRAACPRPSACRSTSSPTAPAPRSSATGTRSSPTGRRPATGRCASGLAARHGVDPSRVFLTNGSLQGFVFLAQRLAAGQARARRAADLRPAAEDPARARRRDRGRPRLRRRRPRSRMRSRRRCASGAPPAFLYLIPTFQNPSGRTLREERRRRIVELAARARPARPRGRPVRARPLRGRSRCRRCSSSPAATTPTARRSRRRSRPACASAGSCSRRRSPARSRRPRRRRTSRPCCSARRPCYEFVSRGLFEPNLERVRGLLRRAPRRDARRARPRAARRADDAPRRRLLPLGSSSTASTRPSCCPGPRRQASRSSRAPTSAASPTRCGSPTASCRPTRSPRASLAC